MNLATLEMVLVHEAAAGEIIREPDGLSWAGRPADTDLATRLESLINAGLLHLPCPDVERAAVKPTDAGWGLFR